LISLLEYFVKFDFINNLTSV